MKKTLMFVCAVFVSIFWSSSDLYAQGHYLRTIRFDLWPPIQPGEMLGLRLYYEDSMKFTPINSDGLLSRAGGGLAAFPENGGAYVLQLAGNTIAGFRGTGSRFGLHSVDLAEFSFVYPYPSTVQFIGYRFDGSVVTTEFTTDGVIDGTGPLNDFQTFYFDDRFSDLLRFESPSVGYAMDNLVFYDVFNVVPEPGTGALAALALSFLGYRRIKRSN